MLKISPNLVQRKDAVATRTKIQGLSRFEQLGTPQGIHQVKQGYFGVTHFVVEFLPEGSKF